jgi:hypothetical protein
MDETASKAGLLQLLNQIHSQYGLLVLTLVLIIVFGCLLFWKLVWRVWSGALSAKESEIGRLVEERDMYQGMVLDHLRASRAPGTKEGAASSMQRVRELWK